MSVTRSRNKKALIVGPISDFGGRQVEVQIISRSIIDTFDVQLLSTTSISSKSFALIVHPRFKWSSVERFIFHNNLIVRWSSSLTKYINKKTEPAYKFIGNKVSYFFYDFDRYYFNVLRRKIDKHDIVFYCGELKSKWLEEVARYCIMLDVPLIVRTTGTIERLPDWFNQINSSRLVVLVHSMSNRLAFGQYPNIKVALIDQTTLNEESLLKCKDPDKSQSLIYGFLGRYAREKGIEKLLHFWEKKSEKLILAGNGQLIDKVNSVCLKNKNMVNLGPIRHEDINVFFNKVDVVIISSHHEAGPLVGIEAMAAGKLILSTRVGAMEERLSGTENQFWFDVDSINSLENQMNQIELLSPEEVMELKNSNREAYLKKYSLLKISQDYLILANSLTL